MKVRKNRGQIDKEKWRRPEAHVEVFQAGDTHIQAIVYGSLSNVALLSLLAKAEGGLYLFSLDVHITSLEEPKSGQFSNFQIGRQMFSGISRH